MNWLRLYITVEGQTEKKFAEEILTPHLAVYSIDVKCRVILTNRKLGARGGILNFNMMRKDLLRLMSGDGSTEGRFTTMVDLYGLPTEFPGWKEAQTKCLPKEKVGVLEAALQVELNDTRFLPYIQLHEFEALLYCDLPELQRRIDNSDKAFMTLAKEVSHLEPEAINEGVATAPSKRIIHHVPIYERLKVRVGAPAAAAIGLAMLREKCPHFNGWVSKLENLDTQGMGSAITS